MQRARDAERKRVRMCACVGVLRERERERGRATSPSPLLTFSDKNTICRFFNFPNRCRQCDKRLCELNDLFVNFISIRFVK